MFCNHLLKEPAAFIEQLVPILDPQMIFCYEEALYIIVSDQDAKTLATYKALVKAATYGQEVPAFYFYNRSIVCAGLEEGHILYSLIFNSTNLVYHNPQFFLPQPLCQRLAKVMKKSRKVFEQGYAHSISFSKSAYGNYLEGVHDIAAFMLHQSGELLLRNLIMAITGQEQRTHSIKENLEACRIFAPKIYQLGLDPVTLQISALIQHLDKAYSCARYSHTYKISTQDLDIAFTLIYRLQQQSRHLMDLLLQPYSDPVTVIAQK